MDEKIVSVLRESHLLQLIPDSDQVRHSLILVTPRDEILRLLLLAITDAICVSEMRLFMPPIKDKHIIRPL